MNEQQALDGFAALSQQTRLRIVLMLVTAGAGGLAAGAIASALDGSAASRVSFHLNHLEKAGLVVGRRDGRSIFAAVVPQLGLAVDGALRVVPIYVAYAVAAPVVGWFVGRLAGLDAPGARATAFSSATRNSLVVLPLAFAIPGAVPVLPAVIVAQTVVELVASLAYMRVMPRMGRMEAAAA